MKKGVDRIIRCSYKGTSTTGSSPPHRETNMTDLVITEKTDRTVVINGHFHTFQKKSWGYCVSHARKHAIVGCHRYQKDFFHALAAFSEAHPNFYK